jgi:hypothetical protein
MLIFMALDHRKDAKTLELLGGMMRRMVPARGDVVEIYID